LGGPALASAAADERLGDEGDAGAVGEVEVGGGVEDDQVGSGAGRQVAHVGAAVLQNTSVGRSALTPGGRR
jgi:hypothetical protein